MIKKSTKITYTPPLMAPIDKTIEPKEYTMEIERIVQNFPSRESAMIAPITGVK